MPDGQVVPRPALERRLDAALGRRLTLVVAPPGSGKTTLLGRWSSTVNATWCVPRADGAVGLVSAVVEALRLRAPGLGHEITSTLGAARGAVVDEDQVVAAAAAIGAGLGSTLERDLALVLDDVAPDPDPTVDRFLWELVRQVPRRLHVVMSGRRSPGFPTGRLEELGELLQLHGRDLVLDEAEVARWLVTLVDGDAATPDLAPQVHAATGGWPPAVRHVALVLAGVPAAQRAAALRKATATGFDADTLVAAALQGESEEAREVLRALAVLPELEPGLCRWLGLDEGPEHLRRFERGGLFVQERPDRPGSVRMRPFVRASVGRALPGDGSRLSARAAEWFLAQGRPGPALRCLIDAGDPDALASALRAHGPRLAEQGELTTVTTALDALPGDAPWAGALRGIVLHLAGDWDAALDHLLAAGRADPVMAASTAWRVGLIHHLRGEIAEADAAYERGEQALAGLPRDAVEPADVALLHAWWASTRWLSADRDGCRELAQRAVDEATVAGDDRSFAAAHTALAMLAALEGDRAANDAHYLRALDHAERAGDLLQVIRIRTNRGSHHLEEGATAEAMAELDEAVRLAELTGFAVFRAIALTNRGEVQLARGDLELARADLERALEEWDRQGSRMRAYAMRLLGQLEAVRGDVARARQLLEECLAIAEAAGDVQGIVPAAAELARLVVTEDADAARRYRDVALSHETSIDRVHALVVAAEVAEALGDADGAVRHARDAEDLARSRRDPGGEVDALLVRARLAADAAEARTLLDRAGQALGDRVDRLRRARIDLVRAEHADPPTALSIAADVRDRARQLGAGRLDARATTLLDRLRRDGPVLEVLTLGGFRLLRHGSVVPLQAWQSRRARDLLKILVARRGRPVPRDELLELLWPDEASERLADRLNVTLSTLRGVLDPDRQYPPDHAVVSAEGALRLDLDHVAVDLEDLFVDVATAESLARTGREEEAAERDRRAVARYRGPFLPEHAYDDWAVPAREEARAAFLAAARRLAGSAARAGDADAEVRCLLRVLEEEPYDEPAHLRLVRCLSTAGRHGEARRAYHRYAARMVELDLEPTPYPVDATTT